MNTKNELVEQGNLLLKTQAEIDKKLKQGNADHHKRTKYWHSKTKEFDSKVAEATEAIDGQIAEASGILDSVKGVASKITKDMEHTRDRAVAKITKELELAVAKARDFFRGSMPSLYSTKTAAWNGQSQNSVNEDTLSCGAATVSPPSQKDKKRTIHQLQVSDDDDDGDYDEEEELFDPKPKSRREQRQFSLSSKATTSRGQSSSDNNSSNVDKVKRGGRKGVNKNRGRATFGRKTVASFNDDDFRGFLY